MSKLSDVSSEAAETLVWIDFAVDSGYLDGASAQTLSNEMRSVLGGLTKMMAQHERWGGPSAHVREENVPHDA